MVVLIDIFPVLNTDVFDTSAPGASARLHDLPCSVCPTIFITRSHGAPHISQARGEVPARIIGVIKRGLNVAKWASL